MRPLAISRNLGDTGHDLSEFVLSFDPIVPGEVLMPARKPSIHGIGIAAESSALGLLSAGIVMEMVSINSTGSVSARRWARRGRQIRRNFNSP
jgi:hypothetical protein